MKERKYSGMFRKRLWLLLVSLFLAIGLLIPGDPVGADDPIPTPATGEPTEWSTVTVTTAKIVPKKIERPSKGDPKLGSSLNQLLEAHRREGLAEAQAFAMSHNMVLQDDRVQVKIVTTEEAIGNVREAVEAVGGEYQTHYQNLLQALVPIGELEALAERPDVQIIREPQRAIPLAPIQIGSQTTEGVAASNASAWHTAGHTGSGVRVAVIDAGFTGYSGLLGTDLPGSVTTYDWTGSGMGGSEHGTACAEVVYDMAYGATMDLHKVSTDVELGNAVTQAIADGVDIISMSLGWTLDGPGDGTGNLANIVNNARSNGIFYALAAGNNAEHSWSGTYNESGYGTHLWASGQDINYFGPGNGDAWVIPAGFPIIVDLHWDDWTAVNQDLDMELFRLTSSGWSFVTGSYNDQAGSYPTPDESIIIDAPYTAAYGVVVWDHSTTRDVCLRLMAWHNGFDLDERVPGRSLVFPADSPDAVTVGAVDVNSPYPLEPYSSRGPTFGPGGSCSGGSTKPDIAAYANVSTVSYGAGVFNGTSAATPHVAGAATLVKGAYPSYSVSQLQSFLEGRAIDLGTSGKDNLYGAGRLHLGLPPPPPVVGPLVHSGYTVDDDNSGQSGGNDDGIIDPGETIELYVTLRNQGSVTATSVNAAISTSDPYVTFTHNTNSNYPDIPGGSTGTNGDDFDFEVDPSTPDGHDIHFDLDITSSNGGPWSDSFGVTVGGGGKTYLPIVLKNSSGGGDGGGIVNGDFENGPTGWVEYSTHGWDLIVTSFPGSITPRSGSWAVWLGGDYNDISYIQQQVTVPAGSPYLAYWHWIASEDVCGWDYGGVIVNDTTVEDVYDLCISTNTGGWVKHVVNLSAYTGQSVSLQIRAETDGSLNSNLVVDDVAFQASASSIRSSLGLFDPINAMSRSGKITPPDERDKDVGDERGTDLEKLLTQ
jgi:hypothetical protein